MAIQRSGLVLPNQFDLTRQGDTSGIARGISSVGQSVAGGIQFKQQQDKIDAEKAAALQLVQADKDAAKFGIGVSLIADIGGGKTNEERTNNHQRQRKEIALMAQQNPAMAAQLAPLLDIENPDQLNLALRKLQLTSGKAQENLAMMNKELLTRETFTTEFDELGNPIGQKGNLSGKVIEDPRAPSETRFKLGTGDMAGFVIDGQTGTISGIDPKVQAQLDKDAEAKAKVDGKLSTKELIGVNDKVTAITKPVREIHAAAQALKALGDQASPAAQIGIVFKFMKALDPSSTVRESEGQLIVNAEGAAQGFANQINKLMGEGALSGPGIQDIVDTANVLANSAVDAASGSVNQYVEVFKDKLEPEQAANLLARVPTRLEAVVPGANQPVVIPSVEELQKMTPEARQALLDSVKQ